MKQLPVAGKALSIIFAVLFMIGCSSTDTKESDSGAGSDTGSTTGTGASGSDATGSEAARQEAEKAVAAVGDTVYFEFDRSTLTRASRSILDAHVALAKTNTDKIRLEGHTDERGTREYNMALGERRSKAVADYMSLNGVASYRIESVSYGEEQPVAYGSGESNWSQNRRVVIK